VAVLVKGNLVMLALFLAPIVGLVYLVEQDRKKMGPPPGQNTQTTIGTGMQTKVSGARLPLMRS
jgi:hypothetical protein